MEDSIAPLIPGIRNAVRAVIVRNDCVLVQHKVYAGGEERLVLPGGAPNDGETLREGLARECEEEIGTTIEILDLIYVADYFKPRPTLPPTRRQHVEFLFECRVPDHYSACNGPHPDKHQQDVVWLPLNQLDESLLHPPGLKPILAGETPLNTYVGLID